MNKIKLGVVYYVKQENRYYASHDVGSNISPKTLDEIKSTMETYIKRKSLQSE